MAKKLIVFVCISLLAGVPCTAATITVDWDGSADHTTIQAAINDSNNFDTVLVADGTYTGAGNLDIDFLGKAITVKSANGPQNCIINCQDSGRGFYFLSGEDPNSALDGFTVTNGHVYEDDGGAIYILSSSPTILNCVISDNSIYGSYNCSGSVSGGGIYLKDSQSHIDNCIIRDNTVYDPCCGTISGGGIYLDSSDATITNCTIINNAVYGYPEGCYGGGICLDSSNATITNCTITDNTADYGGGIYCDLSSPTISNCKINKNTASMDRLASGGGIYCTSQSNPTITNCIITGNISKRYGGGFYNCSGPITNCTIVGNRTKSYYYDNGGGGLYNCDGTITNCIIWDNVADEGDQMYDSSTPTYSCIQDWTGGGIGNIDAEPNFADPGYWFRDTWIDGDYHLRSKTGRWDQNTWVIDELTSPGIDVGDPNSDFSAESWPNGGRINMGVYGGTAEASRGCGSIYDLQIIAADWLQADSVTDIIPYPDGDGIVDLRDYAFLALHWLCAEQ